VLGDDQDPARIPGSVQRVSDGVASKSLVEVGLGKAKALVLSKVLGDHLGHGLVRPLACLCELVDLVLRNFGTSAATDIVLKIDPPPQRAAASDAGHGDVWLPDRVPTLVPGQEWRQLWDSTPRRAEADLRDHHDAVVTFKDPQDKEHCFEYVLDWGATRKRMYATTYGVHDGVKALREISKKMS